MGNRLWLLLGVCLVGAFISGLIGCTKERPAAPVGEAENNYQRHSDIVYATRGDTELCLDIVVPTNGNGPFPAVLFLFGGGFKEGGKGTHSGNIMFGARRGYVGVAADYRLTVVQKDGTVENQFPAALHDVKSAVRWLREHAREYGIDGERIGVSGISAGGNLALMLAVTEPDDGLEGDQASYDYSSSVRAAVVAAPHPDFSDPVFESNRYNSQAVTRYLGGTIDDVPDRFRAASPITYIDRNDAPALLIFGAQDPYVGMNQVRTTEDRIRTSYADHSVLLIAKGHHSFVELASPATDFPLWDYFDAHLKRTAEGSQM